MSEYSAVAPRVYLLSPANLSGKRASQLIASTKSQSDLVRRLREEGAELGEVFASISKLYFRGKLAYASTFMRSTPYLSPTLIITPSRGLLEPQTVVNLADISKLLQSKINGDDPQFKDPLERDLRRLSDGLGSQGSAIFLGSLSMRKYLPSLISILGKRLYVPRVFISMGNMKRGALLLQSIRERNELEYITAQEIFEKR